MNDVSPPASSPAPVAPRRVSRPTLRLIFPLLLIAAVAVSFSTTLVPESQPLSLNTPETYSLSGGQVRQYEVRISPHGRLRLDLSSAALPTVVLTRPDGTAFTPAAKQGATREHLTYEDAHPMGGVWTIALSGVRGGTGELTVTNTGPGTLAPYSRINNSTRQYALGANASLVAGLVRLRADGTFVPVTGIRVLTHTRFAESAEMKMFGRTLRLLDNGKAPDEQAGDQRFAVNLPTDHPGTYLVDVSFFNAGGRQVAQTFQHYVVFPPGRRN